MTEYVKSTNFASKDSLAIGNPLKIVKGTEIDAEFNNISTAVATKADLNSPAFIGSPTAPTPASGNSTTLLATTAFVASAIAAVRSALFPVGSIYTNATDNTNPATLLGFGTWVAFGAGRVPVGFDAGNALFNSAEETGGSYDATLVAHTHTGTTGGQSAGHTHTFSGTTSSAGNHNHGLSNFLANDTVGGSKPAFINLDNSDNAGYVTNDAGTHTHSFSGTTSGTSGDHTHSFTTASSGSSATNANVQPYITVYMWKRTA